MAVQKAPPARRGEATVLIMKELTPREKDLLRFLSKDPNAGLLQMQKHLKLQSRSFTARLLNNLEKKGYIARRTQILTPYKVLKSL